MGWMGGNRAFGPSGVQAFRRSGIARVPMLPLVSEHGRNSFRGERSRIPRLLYFSTPLLPFSSSPPLRIFDEALEGKHHAGSDERPHDPPPKHIAGVVVTEVDAAESDDDRNQQPQPTSPPSSEPPAHCRQRAHVGSMIGRKRGRPRTLFPEHQARSRVCANRRPFNSSAWPVSNIEVLNHPPSGKIADSDRRHRADYPDPRAARPAPPEIQEGYEQRRREPPLLMQVGDSRHQPVEESVRDSAIQSVEERVVKVLKHGWVAGWMGVRGDGPHAYVNCTMNFSPIHPHTHPVFQCRIPNA